MLCSQQLPREVAELDKSSMKLMSAAEKREAKRQREKEIQDMKATAQLKRTLTMQSLDWFKRLALTFQSTVGYEIENLWKMKSLIYSRRNAQSRALNPYDR